MSYSTGVISGTRTAYPSGAPEFTPNFGGFCVAQFLVFCVVFGELLLDFFILVILLSVFLDFKIVAFD